MIGINGNDPLFGFGGIKKTQGNKQQPKVNNDVPVGKTSDIQHKELGDELLTQGFYPGLNISKPAQLNTETVKGLTNSDFMFALNDLQGIEPDLTSFVTGVDPDKLARHMQKPLDDTTAANMEAYMQALA